MTTHGAGTPLGSSPLTPPEAPERFGWPLGPFLLAWGLGAALTFGARFVGDSLITGPCQGHTLLALLMPLLLGPGGLGFTAANWNERPRAMFGLGLVVASLVPALFLSAYDIGQLRAAGCAGGYIIVSEDGETQLSEMTLRPGELRQLKGRIGGYQPETHPGTFVLEGQSKEGSIVVDLPKTAVRAGEVFPVHVRATENAASNRFDWGIVASYKPAAGETIEEGSVQATGAVTVTIVNRQ